MQIETRLLVMSLLVTSMVARSASINGTAANAIEGYATCAPGVTGGAGGETVTVTNGLQLNEFTDSNKPYVIYVSGTLQIKDMDTHVRANKTIIGVGTNATLEGGGFYLYKSGNVIIRNLTIKGSTDDNMGILLSTNVWIDHCTFLNAKDGNLDIRRASDNITVSWCKFYYDTPQDHALSCLLGSNDKETDCEGKLHVTFHHNWWAENCKERMPSVRWGTVHLYNNYYSSGGNNYCIRTRLNAQSRIEHNVFENVKNPWEVYITDPTNTVGKIFATNNLELNVNWSASSTNKKSGIITLIVPGTNTVFTPPYAYALESATRVKEAVTHGAGAGRGDFSEKK